MPPRQARLLPWALIPLLLSACSAPSKPTLITRLQVERLQIPPALLACLPDPEIPDSVMGDRALADYVVSLWQAGDDCRDKLARVKETSR